MEPSEDGVPLLLAAKKGEIVVDLLLMALIMLNFLEVVKVECPSSSFFSCHAPTYSALEFL